MNTNPKWGYAIYKCPAQVGKYYLNIYIYSSSAKKL